MEPNLTVLYVADCEISMKFYSDLLGETGAMFTPTFAMFMLPSGNRLGLLAAHTVDPPATGVGGMELAINVSDEADVDHFYQQWLARGVTILQTPRQVSYGYAFCAADPDGHRLRIYRLNRG